MSKRYDTYKESKVEWLGRIPSEWNLAPTGRVLSVKKEVVGSESSKYQLLSLTTRGVITRDIESGFGKFPSSFDTYQVVHPGDLVMCLFDTEETPRTVGLSSNFGMITGAYTVFNVNHRLALPNYIEYYFISIDDQKKFKPIYTGLRNTVQKTRLLSSRMPLPPLETQHRIVEFLDRETASIDTQVNELEALVALLTERRKALISETVTRGLPGEHTEFKDSGVEWIGEIPSRWDIKKIKRAVNNYIGGSWGDEEGVLDCSIRCIRVADFDKDQSRIHDKNPTNRSYDNSEISRKKIKKGDILLEKSGGGEKNPVGNVVLYWKDESAMFSNFVTKISLRDKESPEFWTYMFKTLYFNERNLFAIKQTTGIQNISVSSYLEEVVPFPAFDEQQRIVEFLDQETQRIDTLVSEAKDAIMLLKEKRKVLISDVVTGKLMVE